MKEFSSLEHALEQIEFAVAFLRETASIPEPNSWEDFKQEELAHEKRLEVSSTPQEQLQEPKGPKLTLEEVRGKLAEVSSNGKSNEVRALIQKYGSSKLSELSPDVYESLLKDVEELQNA